MGDYADMQIENELMSYLDDLNNIDYNEPDIGSYTSKKSLATRTCKYCGKSQLHWEEFKNTWRLFDCHGKLHSCLNKG